MSLRPGYPKELARRNSSGPPQRSAWCLGLDKSCYFMFSLDITIAFAKAMNNLKACECGGDVERVVSLYLIFFTICS